MILHGRLSLYGEYLMRSGTRGLIIPAPFRLATPEHDDVAPHKDYDRRRDTVADLLERRGLSTADLIHGDLPLGEGYAGSTVLALLHLCGRLQGDELTDFVNHCDHIVHGFVPSGVDVASCLRGTAGLYAYGRWEDADLPPQCLALLRFPDESKRTLAEIDEQMVTARESLVPIADHLTCEIRKHARLDYGALLEYSRRLLECGVYSRVVARFVAEMLRQGIAAKAIGGLYDKAVIVFWPDSQADCANGMAVLDEFQPAVLFDGRWPLR